jgi:hypothetical protein
LAGIRQVMDAILSGSGLRVGHGVGPHALRVSTTEAAATFLGSS